MPQKSRSLTELAGPRFPYEAERLILRYVETGFFAFAAQAVQAGKEGIWNCERIRRALDDFLNDFGRRAYSGKHPDPGAHHGSKRFTDALNKASKTWKGWRARAAYCLHFAWYNLCRIHQTLRVTPAMEAGIADRVWAIQDLLA